MQQVAKEQVVQALSQVGVQPNDGLLVHSAIQFLGRPPEGMDKSRLPELYFDALCETVNFSEGTLAAPTFTFAFARGEPYDPQTTPSQKMGVFSEFVRKLPQARRTPHPMQSLATIGKHADDLASRDTASAFDPGSPFERMLELDFKILLLGADIEAISMLHYSEQRANVPYRYWKEFSGAMKGPDGWQTRTYRMFVRDLNIDPQLTLRPVQDYLQSLGQFRTTRLNYGQVSLIRMRDFVSAVDYFLVENPYSLYR
jgi:aminoglycoside 3-N-acetyltransferase